MNKLKSGSCDITLQNKIDTPLGMADQLVWLKKYGAPILGNTFLRPDLRYTISLFENTSNGSTHVTWEPLDEQ